MNASTLPDAEQARFNMVEQQIRPWDVLDLKVLDASSPCAGAVRSPALRAQPSPTSNCPRRINAVDTREDHAHAPRSRSRFAQELQLLTTPTACWKSAPAPATGRPAGAPWPGRSPRSRSTASLSAPSAQQNLQMNNVTNIKVETGDGRNGSGFHRVRRHPGHRLRAHRARRARSTSCAWASRLVVVAGRAPVMTALRITRTTAASFETESLFETVIKPLRGVTVSTVQVLGRQVSTRRA